MIFSCFPPGRENKCEWAHLVGFVAQYNEKYGKSYSRTACLDVNERTRKEPEVRLECDGESAIVLERKAIVWPPKYFKDHHNEHHLFEGVAILLGDRFRNSQYELEVYEKHLKGRTKRQVQAIAGQIADTIKSNVPRAKSLRGIAGKKPMPWRFRALSPYERDKTVQTRRGIDLRVWLTGWTNDLSDLFQDTDEVKTGFTEQLELAAEDAAEKFANYTDCLKFLLVQFFGEDHSMLADEDIMEIIGSANLPEVIDQVWLAQENWVSAERYEIVWTPRPRSRGRPSSRHSQRSP